MCWSTDKTRIDKTTNTRLFSQNFELSADQIETFIIIFMERWSKNLGSDAPWKNGKPWGGSFYKYSAIIPIMSFNLFTSLFAYRQKHLALLLRWPGN